MTGHPVGDVVAPQDGPLVAVGVAAREHSDGLMSTLRTSLGGKTKYSVTVTVRNITTSPLSNVQLFGTAAGPMERRVGEAAIDTPGSIDPGQTWAKTMEIELPTPHVGAIRWTVTASGAGPNVTTTKTVTAVAGAALPVRGRLHHDAAVMVFDGGGSAPRAMTCNRSSSVASHHCDGDHGVARGAERRSEVRNAESVMWRRTGERRSVRPSGHDLLRVHTAPVHRRTQQSDRRGLALGRSTHHRRR